MDTKQAAPAGPSTIQRSRTFARGEWRMPDPHDDATGAAIQIIGNNIVVDFGGTVLRGTPPETDPNQRRGTALRIRGNNITVRNLVIRGYKHGIVARDCDGLVLDNVDASHLWKQRLASTPEQEDLSDWMSFHNNEKDEWLRFGTAFSLTDCNQFTVHHCKAVGGQCGLMLTRSDRGLVAGNDFSFLSAIGVGLYRSNWNRVFHNKIDWCLRGYSHGVYNRGQDSAGILVYEQSSSNVFAYNSVTHGGDGFFLWAGQSTMDTGRGGCDDNLLYANDFSHAPTNGIEATFSRNDFVHNLILECWHGIWGGYSYGTRIVGNTFGGNAEGIAIEHGRDNAILGNRFLADRTAIQLWKNDRQDPNWAYVRKHETTSRDYRIEGNTFFDCERALSVRGTDFVRESANRAVRSAPAPAPTMQPSGLTILQTEGDARAYRKRFDVGWDPMAPPPAAAAFRVDPLPAYASAFLPKGALRGRRFMIVDEWGPYDFARPILVDRGEGYHDVLGPRGRWRLKEAVGCTVSQASGRVPGQIRIATQPGSVGNIKVILEFVGEAVRDIRGNGKPAGTRIPFGIENFRAPIDWKVAFHRWSKQADPSDVHSAPDETHVAAIQREKPFKTLRTDRLEFAGRFAEAVPGDHFLTVAEGVFTVPTGEYILEITTDDGCRAWLDDKPILAEAWKYQGPTLYPVSVRLGGNHKLRIEHFQIDGYAALRVRLRPAPPPTP